MWTCTHRLYEHGSAALPNARYSPAEGLPISVWKRAPYSVTLFYSDDPEHPATFIAFGGEEGRAAAIQEVLGAPIEISQAVGNQLITQINRFLHQGERLIFTNVRQAAARLRGFWGFLYYSSHSQGYPLQKQALSTLLQIIQGDLIGYEADIALNSLTNPLKSSLSDACNLS